MAEDVDTGIPMMENRCMPNTEGILYEKCANPYVFKYEQQQVAQHKCQGHDQKRANDPALCDGDELEIIYFRPHRKADAHAPPTMAWEVDTGILKKVARVTKKPEQRRATKMAM